MDPVKLYPCSLPKEKQTNNTGHWFSYSGGSVIKVAYLSQEDWTKEGCKVGCFSFAKKFQFIPLKL